MIQQYKKIISMGIDQQTDTWLVGKIQLVNTISLVNFIFIISMIFIGLTIGGDFYFLLVLAAVAVIMLIPYCLNYKKKYIASRVVFLSCAYMCICFLAVLFGKQFYFQYYLVPGVGMSLIFFRDEIGAKKWLFTFCGIPLWAFLEFWFLNNSAFIVLGEQYVGIVPYVSSLLIFLTAILMFATFTHESDSQLRYISKINKELEQMAHTDGLTGLYNRRFMDERIDYFFSLAQRQNNFLALVIFDIDFFKKINDTYGHDGGDRVLQAVSQLAREGFRKTDIVGRIGGEEFCVIFTYGDRAKTLKVIERFRNAIEQHVTLYENKAIKITSSFGVSYLSERVASRDDLFKYADEALYEAKNTGRNRVCEYHVQV